LPIFDCHKNRAPPEKIFKGQSGSDSGLGVARVMAVDAFRQKTFATALATAREGGASAFRPHARSKTVLALACSFRWLISAFHKAEK
jgi:hypothetical protein